MLCLHLVSFAAVIRVVTRHATLLPTKGSGEERCVTSDDPNNGCEWDYVYTMPDSVSFMPTRKAIRYSMNTYPICDFPLYRSGRRASEYWSERRSLGKRESPDSSTTLEISLTRSCRSLIKWEIFAGLLEPVICIIKQVGRQVLLLLNNKRLIEE